MTGSALAEPAKNAEPKRHGALKGVGRVENIAACEAAELKRRKVSRVYLATTLFFTDHFLICAYVFRTISVFRNHGRKERSQKFPKRTKVFGNARHASESNHFCIFLLLDQ